MNDDFQPSKYTIGLVWEAAEIAELVEVILAAKGYTVIKYGSSRKALQKMYEKLPDLVFLCNLMLRELSGWELIKMIRQSWNENEVEVIVSSAKGNINIDSDPKVGGYVTKPFDLDELLAVVESVLRKRDERRAMA